MQTAEALRAYFGRVTSMIPELFNMAHAICGNYDLAGYALQYTLMEAWIGEAHAGMGFREGLRNTLRAVAIEEALEQKSETPEFTWDALADAGEDPVLELLAQESLDVRRIAALRYGCGLSAPRIARLTGNSAGRVRETLDRLERRTLRRLAPELRRKGAPCIARAVSRQMSRPDPAMPSMHAIYRAFEAEAAQTRKPSRRISKWIHRVLCGVLVVLCGLVFWLVAALMQPAPLEDPAQIEAQVGQEG